TRELTTEAYAEVERPGWVRIRTARSAGPAHRPTDAVAAGIVSHDGYGPQTCARFIAKKYRCLGRNGDIQLFAVVKHRSARERHCLAELREPATSYIRRRDSIEGDAVLCPAPDDMATRWRVSQSRRHRKI